MMSSPASAPSSAGGLKAPDAPPVKPGSVQVVCPSYGRTGTFSMRTALEILGYDPAYHMMALYMSHLKDHPKLWLDGYEGRGLDVYKIFDGYKAVTDWPASDFYKEILAANPEAKVVVTLRDPDAWWESVLSTISQKNPRWTKWGFFFLKVIDAGYCRWWHMSLHIKTLSMDEEEAKADYARHNKEVLAHVPPDKLLEYSVKEGWEPLCEFLGVPVPDIPFPKSNSTAEIQAHFKRINTTGWVMMAAALTVAGASIAATSFFGGKRAGGALAAAEVVVLTSRIRKAMAAGRV